MEEKNNTRRYKLVNGVIRWRAIDVPNPTNELGPREEGEVEIPYDHDGYLSVWAVPKCEAYPEGYWVKLIGPNLSVTTEPGVESWRRVELLRVRCAGSKYRFVDLPENNSNSQYRDSVDYKAPCIADALDESDLNPDPIEVPSMQYEMPKPVVNSGTALKISFSGEYADPIDCTISVDGNIKISGFDDGSTVTKGVDKSLKGTISELTAQLAALTVTPSDLVGGFIIVKYGEQKERIFVLPSPPRPVDVTLGV